MAGFDILVNNAAFQQHQESIEDLTDEQFERTFKTNIFAYFYMARAAVPHMKPAARSSTPARSPALGQQELLDYSATKGAIHAFTKSLAQNLVEKRHPGELRCTGSHLDAAQRGRQAGEEGGQAWQDVPMERPGSPRRSRRGIVFLRRPPIRATSRARY